MLHKKGNVLATTTINHSYLKKIKENTIMKVRFDSKLSSSFNIAEKETFTVKYQPIQRKIRT